MRNSLEPIYDTLYRVIQQQSGSRLKSWDRGFFYKEDCTKDAALFPYAFLDQPTANAVVGDTNPSGYRYLVNVPIIVMTMADAGDQAGLFFDGDSANESPGAVELCHEIAQRVWNTYIWGFPFTQFGHSTSGWNVLGWTLGPLDKPDGMRELSAAGYLKSPLIAAARTSFIFNVLEDGPLRP